VSDDIDEINDEWREVIRFAKRRGIAPADVKQRLASMVVRRPEAEARGDGTAPKLPVAPEEEDDLMRDVARLQRQAMRMKLQMDLLRSMGILKEDKGDISDVLKVLALASAGGKGEGEEKMDVKEMLTYVIMMKALGGEKSSDWKDLMAILMPLIQQGKGKEIDPFQIIEKMKEIERSAKEEEGEKWKTFIEMMSKGGGGEEDFLGQEARRLMRERIIDALRESLYPSKKIVTEGGKVDWGAIADKILSTIQDAVKRMPVQSPPPPPSGSFEAMSVEQPPAEAPAEQPPAEQAPAEAPAEQPAESPPPPSPSEGVEAGGEG
jgi:DNA-binding transcriptional MerR regulator